MMYHILNITFIIMHNNIKKSITTSIFLIINFLILNIKNSYNLIIHLFIDHKFISIFNYIFFIKS